MELELAEDGSTCIDSIALVGGGVDVGDAVDTEHQCRDGQTFSPQAEVNVRLNQTCCGAHRFSYLGCIWALSVGLKQLECKSDHALVASAKVNVCGFMA